MVNYRAVVAYDGTAFKGWQRQPQARTAQGVLEAALLKVTGKKTTVFGAGRTDAGVHALGQVASFRGAFTLDDATLWRALNAVLPDDLRLFRLERAPDDFHARRTPGVKTYVYRIDRGAVLNPLTFRYALHWPWPLRVGRMRKAAALFAREGDFSAFSSNRDRHPVRTVAVSELRRRGDELVYTVRAPGFLRYMVRAIVGTLLEVGRGRIDLEQVERAFATGDRSLAGPTAPAKGLCLMGIEYPTCPIADKERRRG